LKVKNSTTLSGSTDAQLVKSACQGDKKAFVEIVSRYQNLVTGVTLAVLRDFTLSEDAAQEAFVLAWQKINSLNNSSKLRPWLTQIARHTALNYAKRKRPSEPLDSSYVDQNPRPDELAISREEQGLILSAIDSLPEKYRLPLVLYYREDQSIRTVAESLSQSESTIRKQLSRGRGLLKEQVAKLFGTGLTRTSPGPIFTATVAGLIGAMLKPTAVATTAFSAQPLATAMTSSKLTLTTAAIITAVCIPAGYTARALIPTDGKQATGRISTTMIPKRREANDHTPSPLVREWQQLLASIQNNPKAFPDLYQTITQLPGNLRREAFLSLLIVEWAKLDPVNGLAFVRQQNHSRWQQELFAKEWINRDIHAAIDGLLKGGPGWDYFSNAQLADLKEGDSWSYLAYSHLKDIVENAPERFVSVVNALPIHRFSSCTHPFATYFRINPKAAHEAANQLTGKRREQALSGIAMSWGEEDLPAALAWAEKNNDPKLRITLMEAAFDSLKRTNPLRALELLNDQSFNTTSLGKSAIYYLAQKDFTAAINWIGKNPGRRYEENLTSEFNHRLNENPLALLASIEKADAFESTASVLAACSQLRNPSEIRVAIWNNSLELKNTRGTRKLRKEIVRQSSFEDPTQLMALVDRVPYKVEQKELIQIAAKNAITRADIFHKDPTALIESASESWRPALIQEAFEDIFSHRFKELPHLDRWESFFNELPDPKRPQAAAHLASGMAHRNPQDMARFFASLKNDSEKQHAGVVFVTEYRNVDPQEAAHWLATTPMSEVLRNAIQSDLEPLE